MRRDCVHPPRLQMLKRAFRALVELAGGVEAASGFCRVSKSMLSDYYNPNTDAFAPVDVVMALEDVTGGLPGHPPVTRALAEAAGGLFLPRPVVDADATDWLHLMAGLTGCGGEASSALARALADGKIDATERGDLCGPVRKLLVAAAGLLAQLEDM